MASVWSHRAHVMRGLAACAAGLLVASSAGAAEFQPGACPFVLPPGESEGASVRCGQLLVPEDRGNPAGRQLALAVAVFSDPNRAPAPDPIVYLSGGPGGSALEYVRYSWATAFQPLRVAGYEVILFDQRGVGVSLPALDCPLETETVDEWLGCADGLRSEADLGAYHSEASADDVEDLRQALGYGEINLWGGSYGTRLALEVMRRHPAGLRSVVLDSVYPPDVDIFVDVPANVDRAFAHLFSSCAADAACNAAWPDLESTLVSAVARLDAEPIQVAVTDPIRGTTILVPVDGATLVGVLFQFLYATPILPHLPQMIHEAADGRFSVVQRFLGSFIAQADASSGGMQFSVLCHEEIPFSSRAAQEAAAGAHPLLAPVFGGARLGTGSYDVCAGWGAGRAGAVANAAVASGVPALVLAGEYDPITPPAWGHHAATTLSDARVYQLPATGHGVGIDACGRSLMLAFLGDPAGPIDASCVETRRVPWSLPATAASVGDAGGLATHLALYGPPPTSRRP